MGNVIALILGFTVGIVIAAVFFLAVSWPVMLLLGATGIPALALGYWQTLALVVAGRLAWFTAKPSK